MYMLGELHILEVLQQCNASIVNGKIAKVLVASDWTMSAIGTRMERQVLCQWQSQYVTWTQFLEFPSEVGDNQYHSIMNCGGYNRTYEDGLDCFKRSIKKSGIKFHDCVEFEN
jgi:hypothetical protein